MEQKDYYTKFITMTDGWHTAKELGMSPASLRAMEQRNYVIVDRQSSPMKYAVKMPSEEEINPILQAINEHVKIDDYKTSIVLVYYSGEVGAVKRIEQGGFRTWNGYDVDNRVFGGIKFINIYPFNNELTPLEDQFGPHEIWRDKNYVEIGNRDDDEEE